MIQIRQIQPGVGTLPVKPAPALQAKQVASRLAETLKDRAEFSEIALYLSEIRDIPDVRVDKVAEARAAIAQGDYDGEEVLAKTVDRLIDDLLQEEISY